MPVSLRTALKPGDIGAIVQLHGTLYARECGFDHTFEAYVAGPLADFATRGSPRERIWIAEQDDAGLRRFEAGATAGDRDTRLQPHENRIVGCIAIVAHSPHVAQLRWFLVDPAFRGAGLGKRLVREALDFCRAADYESVILWTVSALTAAAHLYRAAGFVKVEEKPGRQWGVDVVEKRYELRWRPRPAQGATFVS